MNPADEYERTTGLILAAEDWAKLYKLDKPSFGKLVRAEAKLSRVFLEYFKDLAERAPETLISWYAYETKLQEIQAADKFNVDVIVRDMPDTEDGLIMKIIYQPITAAVEAGIAGSEALYGIVLTDEQARKIADAAIRERVAFLVGKRVDSNGNIVPARNPAYHVNDVTRDRIRESIRTSLSLGENRAAATERMRETIRDAKRAQKIASTEAVNAYQGAGYGYATELGAVGKEWQALPDACSLCAGNAGAGIIGVRDMFPSGVDSPSTHPYDRCGVRYVFPEELDSGR